MFAFRSGGTEAIVTSVQKKLIELGIQVDYLICEKGEQSTQYEKARSFGGEFYSIHMPEAIRFRNMNKAAGLMQEIIRKYGPYSAVHVHDPYLLGPAMLAAKRCGVPVRILHMHIATPMKFKLKNWVHSKLVWWCGARFATHALACSREAAQYLKSVTNRRQTVGLMPNGIDLEECKEIRKMSKSEALKRLGLGGLGPVLIQVGRMDDNKNHLFALQVFSEIIKRYPSCRLLFVGEGYTQRKLEEEIERLDLKRKVIFYGVCYDIYKILRACDVLIVPSLFEGFGLVALEAQAMGLPVLASEAVSIDADMGLGLLHRKRLAEGYPSWVKHLGESLSKRIDNWDLIDAAIREKGYDISHSAKLLEELYRNG